MMKLRRMKSNIAQWINLLQNNRSVFQTVVTFIVPKTGLINLVLVGPTAGWQANESLIVLKKIKT